jgi:diguanylate cyclase (GGDEF)-like protein
MINADRLSADAPITLQEQGSGLFPDEMDQHIVRVRRIGIRLFEVADCVIAFGGLEEGRVVQSAEAAFCSSIPHPAGLTVVQDARLEPTLRQHPQVAGTSGIRFYAAHPIYNQENAVVGSISLVDYAPRPFGDAERQLLADLSSLVERELHLRLMSASQLDLQKKNQNLRRKSLIDPLIGTWNRGAIMRILTIEALRCAKMGVPLSLIVLDIDFFKKINDTYGHPAGDSVLVKVASRLRSCIRPQEALGRYGGEEFLVVLPGSSHVIAMAVAERMRLAIASHAEAVGDAALQLTISAGIASTDLFPTATTEELINHADIALYAAKDAGRNRAVQAKPKTF